AVVGAMLVAAGYAMWRPAHAQGNPVQSENTQVGNDQAEWDVAGAGDPAIQGFATDISINNTQSVGFKVASATPYRIAIYRLGYYQQGKGARKVASIPAVSTQTLPVVNQPACLSDASTGLTDCGNWSQVAQWSANLSVSGIYVAKLNRFSGATAGSTPIGSSHIVFIVRDDSRTASIVLQTSDTTWQAYNRYAVNGVGGSLYCGGPISNAGTAYASSCGTRSTKVSYNRPFDTRGHDPQSWLFNAEYPMVRFLEANGYDVKYISGVDTERRVQPAREVDDRPVLDGQQRHGRHHRSGFDGEPAHVAQHAHPGSRWNAGRRHVGIRVGRRPRQRLASGRHHSPVIHDSGRRR